MKIINLIKKFFCKHTYVPSTKIGYVVCIDCSKLKEYEK